MKKVASIMIILITLVCGFAMADSGVDPVPETQGITVATTLNLVGNMASTTDIQWRITSDENGLAGQPPLGDPLRGETIVIIVDLEDLNDPVLYSSTYSEDTYSNGIGLIAYDKNMDLETSAQLSGQWNIEAEKQLSFLGVDGARIYSDENIMVDGVANCTYPVGDKMLCVFASQQIGQVSGVFPAFCNYASAGSTVDMTVANVRTASMDRFIVPSSDTSVELEHDILVTELVDGLPSSGTASACMNVLIMEARGVSAEIASQGQNEGYEIISIDSPLMERIEFNEVTTVTGDIGVLDKQMNYNSMYTGAGELNTIVFPRPT